MKILFETIREVKGERRENLPVSYVKKDGTPVNAVQTETEFIGVGEFEAYYDGDVNSAGLPVVTLKLAESTSVDPLYGVPVTEPAAYVRFENSEFEGREIPNADKALRLLEKAKDGSRLIIRGVKQEQTNTETGEAFTRYTGYEVTYVSSASKMALKAANATVYFGSAVVKADNITLFVGNNWDKKAQQNYSFQLKCTPKDGTLSDETKDEFAKTANYEGKMKWQKGAFLFNNDDLKLDYKNGRVVNSEAKYSDYAVIARKEAAEASAS